MRRRPAVIALVATGLAVSGAAWAQPKTVDPGKSDAPKPDEEPAWQKAPILRRGGFTGGFTIGGALGSGAGYPNDVKKIGRQAYYTDTGIAAGGTGIVWAGAALTDWFNFSVGVGSTMLFTDTTERSAVTLAFRVEAFPLYPLGGGWRDLGILLETGTGTDSIVSIDDPDMILAEGSAPSRLAIGAFYEAFRPWKLALGPFVSYGYSFGETIRAGEFGLGLRAVIYTAP